MTPGIRSSRYGCDFITYCAATCCVTSDCLTGYRVTMCMRQSELDECHACRSCLHPILHTSWGVGLVIALALVSCQAYDARSGCTSIRHRGWRHHSSVHPCIHSFIHSFARSFNWFCQVAGGQPVHDKTRSWYTAVFLCIITVSAVGLGLVSDFDYQPYQCSNRLQRPVEGLALHESE